MVMLSITGIYFGGQLAQEYTLLAGVERRKKFNTLAKCYFCSLLSFVIFEQMLLVL